VIPLHHLGRGWSHLLEVAESLNSIYASLVGHWVCFVGLGQFFGILGCWVLGSMSVFGCFVGFGSSFVFLAFFFSLVSFCMLSV
jgi:hypothetical protein